MKEPVIVIGKLDPEALKDPRAAWFHSDEFRDQLMEGMREAKEMALAKQAATAQPPAKEAHVV